VFTKKIWSDKLFLSPVYRELTPDYYRWLNDPEITMYLTNFYENLSFDREMKFIEKFIENNDSIFAIFDMHNEKHIGNCGILDIDQTNRSGELGIFIGDKSFHGKGYGTDAVGLLCDYGFSVLNLNHLYLWVFEYNTRAVNTYKKIGFKVSGRKRCAKEISGKFYDVILMDILKKEFSSSFYLELFKKRGLYAYRKETGDQVKDK